MSQDRASEDRFTEIVRTTESRLRAHIAGMGVSLDAVDDIAQDVYLAFYDGLEQMPADVEPLCWLKGIARNMCRSYMRSQKRLSQRKSEALAELMVRQAQAIQPKQDPFDGVRLALQDCMGKLQEKSRRMILLRYQEGQASESIARAFSMTPGAVRVAMLRLRNALKDCMAQARWGSTL